MRASLVADKSTIRRLPTVCEAKIEALPRLLPTYKKCTRHGQICQLPFLLAASDFAGALPGVHINYGPTQSRKPGKERKRLRQGLEPGISADLDVTVAESMTAVL